MNQHPDVTRLAAAALQYIEDGFVVGLGSGRAAQHFVRTLGQRVQQGFRQIRGVPTSSSTANFALQCGIPLTSLDEVATLDIAVDGRMRWTRS